MCWVCLVCGYNLEQWLRAVAIFITVMAALAAVFGAYVYVQVNEARKDIDEARKDIDKTRKDLDDRFEKARKDLDDKLERLGVSAQRLDSQGENLIKKVGSVFRKNKLKGS